MKKLLTLTFSICLYIVSFGQANNLIQNGKFEKGVESWQVLLVDENEPIKAGNIEYSSMYDAYGLADNFAGTHFVELDALSGIQQTIATEKQTKYVLLFAYTHRPNAGDKHFIIRSGNEVIYTKKIENTEKLGNFQYAHIEFEATSDQTNIQFYVASLNGTLDKGILLTDVICSKAKEIDLDLYYEY
ncbi:MAG: DUF642 domain-containing protein [Saprospiraceae bacterium]|nr:DUF642 domain-containing protein [Saprospiraceae bacterium]